MFGGTRRPGRDPGNAEGDRSMFSAYDFLAKQVFPPKNGPVPSRPVNAYFETETSHAMMNRRRSSAGLLIAWMVLGLATAAQAQQPPADQPKSQAQQPQPPEKPADAPVVDTTAATTMLTTAAMLE